MKLLIKDILKNHKRKTISLLEIQKYLPGDSEIGLFNNIIAELIQEEMMIPSKSSQIYTINNHLLSKDKHNEIVQTQLLLQSDMKLDAYLALSEEVWEEDYPYVFLIDHYLMSPSREEMSTPECAYLITGNEKWIEEEGGKEVLQRLGVWEHLPIVYFSDPLAVAINMRQINNSQKHLIVENKSIFYKILKVIDELPIASLIYGEGWHITSAIESLHLQLGITVEERTNHEFYYFGDLDWEGIAIWHSVSSKTILATTFYEGLLQCPLSSGKLTQNQNETTLEQFLQHFSEVEQERVKELLHTGKYMPQEALSTQDITERGRLL